MMLEGSNASTVLTWVRPDLDKHLNQVRGQIEHIANSPHIGDGVENTSEHLTQLKYTFEALVLQGATLVVEEMITLCDELGRNNVRDRKKAFGAMMDAIVVVPSYLDRLQAGHHDLPILLLPVINELRAAYNANIVSEATLFAPSLDVPLPELERQADEHEPAFDEVFQVFAQRMCRQWETALLHWLQTQDNLELLAPLHSVCETMQRRVERMDLRRLWWIAAAVIGGLLDGVTDNDMHLRRLFARLHLTLKTLSDGGEEATEDQSIDSISQALLFHIAQAKPGSASVDSLRERFRLQELVPDRDVLIRARGAVTGRNRELYISLGSAVRDELSLIKDALDLELRTGEIEHHRREQSHEALLRLKDTLKMMGLGDSAQSIEKLLPTFEASEDPDHDPDHRSRSSLLMELASELIQVESVLEEQITTLGEPLQEEQEPSFIDLPWHEQRRIRTHLLDETVVSLHQVQDGVRRHFDGNQNADYTTPMEHIAGALELIGEQETASLALKLRNALGNLLRTTRTESAISPEKLEAVTDAVAAFELYLAGCRDQQSNRGRFFEILKDRLDHLPIGEMEVVKTTAPPPAVDTATTETSDAAVETALDPELQEVFLEEFESVMVMFGEQVPLWIQRKEDTSLLTVIRRGFHTLKGSGRMVGANEIGDFSWHIEELLNTLLEGDIGTVDDVVDVVRLSEAVLPAMKSRLQQRPSWLEPVVIESIIQQANSVAAGSKPDWASLDGALPASIAALLPGEIAALPKSEIESSGDAAEVIEPTLKELVCKELAAKLIVLKGLMDNISRDRKSTASEEEILAIHTIVGTTALDPLGREADIAKALEGFLNAQSQSKKAFTDAAMWAVATSLAHFETCLAVHEGDPEAKLADDANSQIEQLLALTVEFEVPAETRKEAEEVSAEEPQEEIAADASEDTAEVEEEIETEEELAEIEQEPVDTEILSIFLEEATVILERCDSLLNEWRDNLPELSIVQNLQREIHTFKGGARMAGVSALGNLSHGMETLLERIAGQLLPPSISAIEVLEQGCDKLNVWTEQAAQGTMPQAGEVLKLFGAQVDALTAVPVQPSIDTDEPARIDTSAEELQEIPDVVIPEVKPEAVEPEAVEPEVVEPEVVEPEAVEPEVVEPEVVESEVVKPEVVEPEVVKPATSKPLAAKPPGEEAVASQQIRVNADLLDSLVNSASEISILRSRLEQEVSSTRENLKEFDGTVSRLREQFRKLEMETETQIRSTYQTEAPAGSAEFDPLEMDRFSSIQQLSRSLSESVADLLNLQESLDHAARKSEALLVQQSRASNELQEGLMQTRMVHFGNIAPRLRRIIRTAAGETRKKARLQLCMTDGGDLLDRNVLERITAPLEHLLRNSIVHGIEKPSVRSKLKKPEEGQLTITVAAEATEFVVQVEDDGAGLDLKAIQKRAIATGLIHEDSSPQPQQLLQLILTSGFSTSKTVTALAGRGVGMDVVNSEIKQIGGSVEIASEEGKGTCFTIRIPFTLAVMQAIGMRAGEHRYLIPVASVAGVARMLPDDYTKLLEHNKPVYEFAGESYSILDLESLLGEPSSPLGDDTISMLMIKSGGQRAAFRVPELLGHREIVIKPVGPQISSVPGILGGSITSDGQVIIIIDVGPLIRQAVLTGARAAPPLENIDIRPKKTLAMVADDSITMRKVSTRVLESHDFEVVTARDGMEATKLMQERVPDILLLDIEMPRMNGYQVAEFVRADARLRDVPIVMITSRAGKKHRDRGMEAGANAYLSKPYKESELIKEVYKLLKKEMHQYG
jgi:chemosensory pili system protein ChpA (sensor histidine kinase/response regulator)